MCCRNLIVWALVALVPLCREALSGPAAELPPPRLVCGEPVFDFGNQSENDIVRHRFDLKNVSGETVNISRVHAGCGCTAAVAESSAVEPGTATSINVAFTLKGRQGRQKQPVTVETDDPHHPRFVLTMTGMIVSELTMDPRQLRFANVRQGTSPVLRAELSSLKPDVVITGIQGEAEAFHVRIGPDRRHILVGPLATLPPGVYRNAFTVLTDHPDGIQVPFVALAVIAGPLTVAPREVVLNINDPSPGPRAVLLRTNDGAPVRILDVKTPDPAIVVTWMPMGKDAVRLTLSGLNPASHDKTVITVQTDVASARTVVVPIRVVQP